jgi:hypothetical protein
MATKQVGAKSETTTTTTEQLKCNKILISQLNIKKKQHPAQYSKIQDELFPETLRNKIGKL